MLVLLLLSSAACVSPAFAQFRFSAELEAGPVWQTHNEVQIPNTSAGTRFSLVDLAGEGPWPSARLYLSWNITERHGLRALLAPFSYTETGTFTEPVDFAGETYAAGIPTDGTYQFNSWRITYRYRFYSSDRWRWWVGFTAKLRDAKIRLEQGSTASEDTDLGFVPLLYVRGDLRFADDWHLVLDLDGLAGGPGRAVDVSLKLGYDLGEQWNLAAGYRLLEGGADVEAVYNFAWFNYAVVSLTYRF
jgi:hypothetical protein